MDINCPVCDSPENKTRFITKGHKILTCKRCRLAFLSRQPTQEELDAIYSENYFSHCKYQDLDTLLRENSRRKALLSQSVVSENARILDVGCASGDFIGYIKEQYQCWGIDYSESAINMAKDKFPDLSDRLKAGTIFDCRFDDHFFDAIVLWDVLEHLGNPLQSMLETLKFLKPGGYLLLSTPDIGSTIARILGKYWAFMTPPEHQVFFGRHSIYYLSEKLEGVSIRKTFRKGKWVNVGFLLYKVKRIIPWLIPGFLLKMFNHRLLRKWSVYIPSKDIRYVVFQKST